MPIRQFGSQSKLALFLIPEPVPYRNRRIKDFPILVYRKREKEADHIVAVQVIGAIMGGMVMQFGTKFKMDTGFLDHGIINGKKKRLVLQRAGNSLDRFGHSNIIPNRVIIGISFQCIVKCVK